MQAGALDASVLPALMKKGRGGYVIRVIARQEQTETFAGILMEETGSLGVRVFPGIHRLVAERQERSLEVEICGRTFPARIKVSRTGGRLISIKPEYEDCEEHRRADRAAAAQRDQKSGRGSRAGSRDLTCAIPSLTSPPVSFYLCRPCEAPYVSV